MSFFSRLVGKAPADVSLPEQSAEAATPIAGTHAEPEALSFGPRLLELACDETDPGHRAAQKRLIELLDADEVSVEQLPWDSARRTAVLAVVAAAANPDKFSQVASRIDDASVWKTLATTGNTAKLRQLAAARIEAVDDLRAVMKLARERDKSVYRIAKEKLDAINAAARELDAQRAHMQSLAETIERLSYKPFDGAYAASVDHLEKQWRALDVEIPPDLRERATAAFDRAREVIAGHIHAAGMQAAHEAAVANAPGIRASTLEELQKILGSLYEADVFDEGARTQVSARLAKIKERWRATLDYRAATPEEMTAFPALCRAIERTCEIMSSAGTLQQQLTAAQSEGSAATIEPLERLIKDRHLLGDELPGIVASAALLAKQWREKHEAERASAADAERHIAQLIHKAQHALRAGRSRQAFGMRRSIDAKLARLPKVPKPLTERLQQLDAKLQEVEDWRRFAVTPKRSELIERMQALIGAEISPPQLAEEIKRLQEEWKTLAKTSTDSDEDWEKFHAAAQAAYAPCKAYFGAQAEQREHNLDRRRSLLARIEQYETATDWEQVDWRNVANAVRAAKQEWRTCGPTERAATKPIEKQFNSVLKRIQDRLDREYDANLERKRALVTQSQRLAELTDSAQAANEVKRLQHAWRQVGITPRAEGQRLWEAFKTHCDAVFEQRRKEHTDRMAEREQHEERALALCMEVESASQLQGEALYGSAARIREARDEYAQLGELPRDKAQEVQRRFRRAVEQFEHAIARQRQREGELAWDSFFDAVNRIRLHQLEQGALADDTELRRQIDAIERWPKGAKQAIEQRLATQANNDAGENEAQLRALAIRAEIVTGVSTPQADQSQRRAMQLQALVKGIGRGTTPAREQLEELAMEWAAVGPVATEPYEALFARFKRCWSLRHGRG